MTKYPPKDNIKVTEITNTGFNIVIRTTEYFCPFDRFPWFHDKNPDDIRNVEGDADHLFWDVLDVDLSEDSFKRLATVVGSV